MEIGRQTTTMMEDKIGYYDKWPESEHEED